MTANQFRLAVFLVLVVVVVGAGLSVQDDHARAQVQTPAPPATAPVGRFQISAYSTPSPENLNPGCYIVDTANGKVWHTRLGAGLVEVLRQPLLVPAP
jgi:hypothetical protein